MSQLPSDPEYVLRGVAGQVFGRSYPLLSPTTVGRAPECDICLNGSGISRMHARLRPLDYGIEVEDLKSTNGSFLNGQRVTVAIARIGDEIAFDELRFRVEPRRGRQATTDGPARRIDRPQRGRALWLGVGIAILIAALAYAGMRWIA
jgi:pSer/pThr/pTyr-binding forkhead associated (FHA) protein